MKRIAIIIIIFVVSGCYYDRFDELHPLQGYVDTCDPELPDTYQAVTRNIILVNCYSCHNNSRKDGGINLATYELVKALVQNGKLMGSIRHENGYEPMPRGTKLKDCDINQIQDWIDAGMPQ